MSRYIDADAVRESIENNICKDCENDKNLSRCGGCMLDVALDYIIAQPTADVVERKQGEWLYKDMKGQFCSVCGKQSVWKFDFCSNCGADMRGDND